MKFVISKHELSNLLTRLQNIVSAKPAIPILSNLLIEAVNDEVIITSTDLTVGMRCYSRAKILEEGATTLPARRFTQLIRELTAANIEITSNQNEVTEIVADSSRFKLNGMSRNEFPSLPDLTGAAQFTLKQQDLKNVLFRTAFAVSREDTRYVLSGVFMHIANSQATFVGTDGKRLAKSYIPIQLDATVTGSYIIPLKAVEEILKNLHEEGDAKVYLMQDKIAVNANNTLLVTKLLSGEYPDVTRVIPQKTEIHLSLHREELMTLLRQIALFTVDMSHSVRFSLSNGELNLTANNMEIGEGKVGMAVHYQGPELDIAFNPRFFLDILSHSIKETIALGITDAYTPGLITDCDKEDSSSQPNPLFVLMPMRLNEEA